MTHKIKLYGFGPTRSVRCQWTLLELGVPFDYVDNRELIGSEELKKIHPQAKVPAIEIDGNPLFESAAICTYLCDLHPEINLIPDVGTWERARHDQWVSFTLTELESYLWSNFKHTGLYPEEKRAPGVIAPNNEEFRNGARVINDVVGKNDFILGDGFSVTDIIVGWTVNWGRRMNQIDGLDHLMPYLNRLYDRKHCLLNRD